MMPSDKFFINLLWLLQMMNREMSGGRPIQTPIHTSLAISTRSWCWIRCVHKRTTTSRSTFPTNARRTGESSCNLINPIETVPRGLAKNWRSTNQRSCIECDLTWMHYVCRRVDSVNDGNLNFVWLEAFSARSTSTTNWSRVRMPVARKMPSTKRETRR